MNRSMRVILADDHEMMRAGLRSLLQGEADVEIVAEAADGRTAVELAARLSPDVVVMDVQMPDLNGIEATRQIRAGGDGPRVIALSAHSDRRFAAEMLRAGASGYVLKDAAFDDLTAALRAVVARKAYLSPGVAGAVLDEYVRGEGPSPSAAFAKLSPREREVLQLMAEGRATKEVASDLHVSPKTVETHRRNIMEKLDLHSVAELTKYAVREGLTAP